VQSAQMMEVVIAASILQIGSSWMGAHVSHETVVANFDVAEQARTYPRRSHNMYVKPISPPILLTCISSAKHSPVFSEAAGNILHLHVADGICPLKLEARR
jgi:hypothetical protein